MVSLHSLLLALHHLILDLRCFLTFLLLLNTNPTTHTLQTYLSVAQGMSGADVRLSGALGKRTRFQERAVAQLMLDVTAAALADDDTALSAEEATALAKGRAASLISTPHVPQHVHIQDDTLLPEMMLAGDAQAASSSGLPPHVQALVLALCLHVQNSNARHE